MRTEFQVFRQSLGWHGRDKEVQKWLNGPEPRHSRPAGELNQEATLSEI